MQHLPLAVQPPYDESTLPLGRAIGLIASTLRPRGSGPPMTGEALDRLALSVSALVPILVVENGVARSIAERELRGALFSKGGAELRFTDGRAPMTTLALSHTAIARVLYILKGALA